MSPAPRSKLRRSFERTGPVLVALALGVVLVVSSALSYRDARAVASIVSERQGIAFLHRVDAALAGEDRPVRPETVRAALESQRALGLTYVAVLDHGRVVAEAGQPRLAGTEPRVGAPAFGEGRVRMVSHDDRRGPPPFERGPGSPPPPFDHPPGPPPDRGPPPGPPPPGGSHRGPRHDVVIEFEPVASTEALRRALAVLLLSSGAAALLTAAAFVLGARARRTERTEQELAAQRHLAELGQMSAVLAHEIRNPLAALKGHAQLLAETLAEDAALGPRLAPRVDHVIREAVRLEHLTNDLLDFARSGTVARAPASPAALLERAAAATDPARVERDDGGAPVSFPLDAGRVEQVLINLLDNALAVTPPDAKVQATAARERDALVYTVRDRGPGVAPAERARIFDAFHTTKLRGTGLGLAVSKRIIELHGGRIDVLDAAGGGAVFRVHIPAPSEEKPA